MQDDFCPKPVKLCHKCHDVFATSKPLYHHLEKGKLHSNYSPTQFERDDVSKLLQDADTELVAYDHQIARLKELK